MRMRDTKMKAGNESQSLKKPFAYANGFLA
jgi:hypothetical protein